MAHLWVDWNEEIPQIQGPYIPEWIKRHEHWHGLGWSTAGACVGAGLTAVVRKVATSALSNDTPGQSSGGSQGVIRFPVEIRVDKTDKRLKPGMSARCAISP